MSTPSAWVKKEKKQKLLNKKQRYLISWESEKHLMISSLSNQDDFIKGIKCFSTGEQEPYENFQMVLYNRQTIIYTGTLNTQ